MSDSGTDHSVPEAGLPKESNLEQTSSLSPSSSKDHAKDATVASTSQDTETSPIADSPSEDVEAADNNKNAKEKSSKKSDHSSKDAVTDGSRPSTPSTERDSSKSKDKESSKTNNEGNSWEDSETAAKPVKKTFFDLTDFVLFWSRIEAGFNREMKPSRLIMYLEHAYSALERAVDGDLPQEHLEHLKKDALRATIISIVARSAQPWPLELKPNANDFLQLATQFILDNLGSDHANHLCQSLHRIYLNNHEYCPFFMRQSKEELPDDVQRLYLPNGLNATGSASANDPDVSTMSSEQIEDALKSLTSWVRINKGERSVSPFYFCNINYFGQIGGFQRMYELIETSPKMPLFTLKLHVKVICSMRQALSIPFLKLFLPKFSDLVFERLLEWFGVNLKPELKTHYGDTIDFLQLLLQEIMTEEQAISRLDNYHFSGCLMLFKTDNLEKRLRGLRDLKALVERTHKNEERRFAAIGKFFTGTAEDEEERKKRKQPRINPKTVMQWINKNDFVELFFQMLQSHIEILRQGTPILIFVAQQGQLDIARLDQLWTMSTSMHEHDKRILNSSLVALVPHLPPSHLDHLITQISSSPLSSIDEQVVDLILNLTTLSVAADTKHKWNGLELLWKLCQDPQDPLANANNNGPKAAEAIEPNNESAVDSDSKAPDGASPVVKKKKKKSKSGAENVQNLVDPVIAHKAFVKLCDLLTTEECASQRPIYMERCYSNLEGHFSVSLSIEILRRCIDAYPARRRKKAVTDLEGKRKIISLIFADFQYYKETAIAVQASIQAQLAQSAQSNVAASSLAPPVDKKRRKASIGDDSSVKAIIEGSPRPGTPVAQQPQTLDVNTMLVLGRPHLTNVIQRLGFLEYIISNVALSMTLEQVDKLWDLFITQALSPEEREATFGWLERASSGPTASDVVLLQESQLQHLFSVKMLNMDGSQLTSAGYQLFERYFTRINEKSGKVKFGEEKNDKTIGLVSIDAIGLDKLWEIALENEDKSVTDAAISFLNLLHLNLELFMNRAKAIKIREDYVRLALDKLQSSSDQMKTDPTNHRRRVRQCLRLLQECVADYEELKGESSIISGNNANAGLLSGWVFGDVFAGKKGRNMQNATTVKLFLKSAGKSPQRLVLNSQTTLKSVAEKAAELFNFDIYDTLRLSLEDDKDRELKEFDKTLGELKIADDSTIVVRKANDAIEGNPNVVLSVYSGMIQSLLLAVGGVGATTESCKSLISRAEAAFKAGTTALAGASPTKSVDAAPIFPALQRPSLPREIRLTDAKKGELHPARILCSSQNFSKLYGLLESSDESLGEPIWALLSMLPKSDTIVNDLTRILGTKNINWNAHFPSEHPFQMLYNFQILEHLISKALKQENGPKPASQNGAAAAAPGAQQNANEIDKSWVEGLVSGGLLEHCLDKLFQIKFESIASSKATKRLLPQLLRIINMLALEVNPNRVSQTLQRASSFNLEKTLHTIPSAIGRFRLLSTLEHLKIESIPSESLLKALMSKLMSLISSVTESSPQLTNDADSIASNSSIMEDDPLIVQEAITLLIPLIVSSISNLQSFFEDPKLPEWLISLLLKSPQISIRECGLRGINELVTYTASTLIKPSKASKSSESSKQSPALLLLNMLLPALLEHDLDDYAQTCDQFFLVLEILIREVNSVPYTGPHSKSKEADSNPSAMAHPVLLDLIKRLISKIEARPVVERFAVAGNEDKVLIGMMQTIHAVVRRDGAHIAGKKGSSALYKPSCRSLVKELFHNCLFAIPTSQSRGPTAPPKCKTKASRSIAYKLLTELCSQCDKNLNVVLRLLQKQVVSIDMGGDYNFYSGRNEKSTTGYVGLQNQGATCYMNATMQQLYMVNSFRQAILSAVDPQFFDPIASVAKLPPEKKKKKPSAYYDSSDDNSSEEAPVYDEEMAIQKLQKESVLYQLQRMFAYLQEGEKRSFDTKQFCHSYKDFEGNPVNTSQQMDANEYYNRLFDSLETRLSGTPQAKILQEIFGGKYANQLIGIGNECSHRRESQEPFYSISVDIKHKATLQDSLKAFVDGEVLSGENKFECSSCNKQVDTLKRCLLHSLPPILVIHLKRFEFQYEQMKNYKLNTSCSFPMELDMEPYMREYHAKKEGIKQQDNKSASNDNSSSQQQQREEGDSLVDQINEAIERKASGYYDYELAGVVVHVGSSDAGHYYSFIKERPDSLPHGRVIDSTVGSKWFEFNDSSVTEFDPAKIPVECFGGEDEVMEWTDETRTAKRAVKRPRTNNAYILIYQRKSNATGSSSPNSLSDQSTANTPSEGHSRNPSSSGVNLQNATSSNDQANASSTKQNEEVEVEELNQRTLSKSQKAFAKQRQVESQNEDPIDSKQQEQRQSSETQNNHSQTTGDASKNETDEIVEAGSVSAVLDPSVPAVKLNGVDSIPSDPSDSKKTVSSSSSTKDVIQSEKSRDEHSSAEAVQTSDSKPSFNHKSGPLDILASIWEENRAFIMKKHLFDPDYFSFVWSIVSSNLPPVPPRTKDEIARDHDEHQRKADASKITRERRELERETLNYPSPFALRVGVPSPNQPPLPGPKILTVGSGANAMKIEVKATNNTPSSLKQEEARRAKERKEEEKRKLKEKTVVDADEQRLEQDKKMAAAEKSAKEKKQQTTSDSKNNNKEGKKDGKDGKDGKEDKDPVSSSDPREPKEKKPSQSKESHKEEKSNKGELRSREASGSSAAKEANAKEANESSTTNDESFAGDESTNSEVSRSSKVDLCGFVIDFIRNIYVHARETPLLGLWLSTVYRLLAHNLPQARKLLHTLIEDEVELAHHLLYCNSEKARSCHAQLIVAAMRALAPKERQSYNKAAKQLSSQEELSSPPPSYCIWFLDSLWGLSKTARRNHFDYFFHIFAQFASFGPVERAYLKKRGFILEFIHFALYFEPAARHSRLLSTPRPQANELAHLVDCLALILLACDAETPNRSDQPPTQLNPDDPLELSDKEHPNALGPLFTNFLMREDINSHAMGRIFTHFAWENKELSNYLIRNMTRGILETTVSSQTRGYLDVLFYVIKTMDDSIHEQRMDLIINEFVTWIGKWKVARRAGVERLIQSFFIMASLHPTFKAKVMKKKNYLNDFLESAGYKIQ